MELRPVGEEQQSLWPRPIFRSRVRRGLVSSAYGQGFELSREQISECSSRIAHDPAALADPRIQSQIAAAAASLDLKAIVPA
jgi:hypothetical protein